MKLQTDICVVGNGAIGKVAALGMAQAGLNVSLLTPVASPAMHSGPRVLDESWDVRVYALNAIARDLLTSLKVWDALDATRVAAVDAMVVRGDSDSQQAHLSFDAYSARTNALAWIVEDANLNAALDAALKFAPNLQIVSGRATQLHTDAETALINLENGDQIKAALVVGADGGQSWVRSQCDIDISYRSYRQRAVVANFATENPHHGVAHQWFTSSEGIVALLPLPGQRVSLVWSAPDSLAEQLLHAPPTQLAQRLSALPQQPLGKLAPLQPENVKAFPLALIRPQSIIAPRVALVGDAAHVIHPLAGQGMNLGFADVATLLKLLASDSRPRDCGDQHLLRRYARTRQEEILLMQAATDGLERLFAADFEPIKILRNQGLNLINKLPGIKRQLMSHALGKMR